jgi:hypothetical protein
MYHTRMTDVVSEALGTSWLIAASQSAGAHDALKVIDNPGGGQVIYGPSDQDTPQTAMANVLHYVHTHFGAAPLVGNVLPWRCEVLVNCAGVARHGYSNGVTPC